MRLVRSDGPMLSRFYHANGTYYLTPPARYRQSPTSASFSASRHLFSKWASRSPQGGRDIDGRLARSAAAKEKFMRMTGFPHGRPGYVVDHIIPLAKGGLDDPSNMQWQTVAEAKAKDKWERH